MTDMDRMMCLRAVHHFGVENQTKQALQEMGELIVALERRGTDRFDRANVVEEIADCIIMMEQLRMIYGGERVDSVITQKINRLERKLNDDSPRK